MIGGRVLDPTAILQAANGGIYASAVLEVAVEQGIVLALPGAALMSAWAAIPAQGRPFMDLLLSLPAVVVDPVDAAAAAVAGVLIAEAQLGLDQLGLAHAIHVSHARGGWPIITGDPDTLLAIDPHAPFESLP